MSDAREEIVAAVLASVAGLEGFTTIRRGSGDGVTAEEMPAIEVWDGGMTPFGERYTGQDDWTMDLTVSVSLVADAAAGLLTALNAAIATANGALLADRILGGKAMSIRCVGVSAPYLGEEGAYVASADLSLEVDFSTPEGNLASLLGA